MAQMITARLSEPDALKLVREIASDTNNIVVIKHAKKRQFQRRISRRQIELCIQKGVVTEGPFINQHGLWQLNLSRLAAGEEITCVVAIDLPKRLLVITTF